MTGGLALLVYAIVDAERAGWTSTQTLVGIGASLALLATFLIIETRARKPLVPLSTFRLQTLRGANVIGVLLGVALFSMFFLIALYLQQVLRFDALEAGLAYLPMQIVIIVAAGQVASRLVTRFGFKPTLVAGMLLIAAGLLWFTQVSVDGSFTTDVLGPSIVGAAGLGLAFVPVTIAAFTGIRHDQAGLASGLINTSQQVGGVLGIAIVANVASAVSGGIDPSGPINAAQLADLTDGFQAAFAVGAGFALLGAIAALVLISSKDSQDMVAAAQASEPVATPA